MKIDRLISIIMVLLERDKISASRLAEMFEVTRRTIFRDIETINQAGIPIITYPGVHGGIGIMSQYKIEKRLFTVSDITALLTGLGSMHSTMSSEEIMNAMAKVKGLIPAEQIKEIELKSNQVVVDHTPWLGNKHLKLHEETYTPREFDSSLLTPSGRNTITIKLLVDSSLLDLMLELCGEGNVKPCGNNKFTVRFPFTDNDFGYQMLLRFGDKCECLEPPHVRAELIHRIRALLGVYEK